MLMLITSGAAGAAGMYFYGHLPSASKFRIHYDFQNARFVFPLANRRWEDNVTKDTVKLGVNWRLNWGPDSGVR